LVFSFSDADQMRSSSELREQKRVSAGSLKCYGRKNIPEEKKNRFPPNT